jgi:phosphoribosylformylglycinamidine (FGAM) synthase PurS component
MFNLKNLKIVKQLKAVKPRLKWLMFSQIHDYKVNSKYIDMICEDNGAQTADQKLEELVRASLIKEFTPEIQKMNSYEFLVDAVVYNLKKKQLAQSDNKD